MNAVDYRDESCRPECIDMIIESSCKMFRENRPSRAFDVASTPTEDFVGSNIEIRTYKIHYRKGI